MRLKEFATTRGSCEMEKRVHRVESDRMGVSEWRIVLKIYLSDCEICEKRQSNRGDGMREVREKEIVPEH